MLSEKCRVAICRRRGRLTLVVKFEHVLVVVEVVADGGGKCDSEVGCEGSIFFEMLPERLAGRSQAVIIGVHLIAVRPEQHALVVLGDDASVGSEGHEGVKKVRRRSIFRQISEAHVSDIEAVFALHVELNKIGVGDAGLLVDDVKCNVHAVLFRQTRDADPRNGTTRSRSEVLEFINFRCSVVFSFSPTDVRDDRSGAVIKRIISLTCIHIVYVPALLGDVNIAEGRNVDC